MLNHCDPDNVSNVSSIRRRGYTSFRVTELNFRSLTQNQTEPFFLRTKTTGDAHGLLEGCTHPSSTCLVTAAWLFPGRTAGFREPADGWVWNYQCQSCERQFLLSRSHQGSRQKHQQTPALQLLLPVVQRISSCCHHFPQDFLFLI